MGLFKLVQSGRFVETYNFKYHVFTGYRRKKKKSNVEFKNTTRRQDNLYRLKRDFVRLVRANLGGTSAPYLLTLTIYSKDVSLEQANRELSGFCRKLREYNGTNFRYISVVEFQKRGSVHYHVLCWCLKDELKNERQTRMLQRAWGLGFVDLFQTDGSDRLSYYLAKYMSKAMQDKRLCGKKAFSTSRNIMRPVSVSHQSAYAYIEEIVGVDNPPCKVSSFETLWLGRCDYKMYKI